MNKLRFCDFLNDDSVLIDCHINSKKRALELLSKLLTEQLDGQLDFTTVLDGFIQREKLGSTTLGNCIALPHARFSEVKQPVAALIRLYQAITYDDQEEPVQLLIGMLLPEDDKTLSLEALGSAVSQLRDSEKLQAIMQAEAPEQITELFQAPA